MKRDYLRTCDVADVLNMPIWWVREEIRDGKLPAEVIQRDPSPGRTKSRPSIRVYPEPFARYLERNWPQVYTRIWPDVLNNARGWTRTQVA